MKSKRLILSLMFLLAILLSAILAAPGSIGQVSTMAGVQVTHIDWVISENIACLNETFCSTRSGLITVQLSATAFSDHTAFDILMVTHFNSTGSVIYRAIERDHETWRTGKGTSFLGATTDFILVSGMNRTTVFADSHRHIAYHEISNFDTGIPAQQGSWGCAKLIGVACPGDVTAFVSVTNDTFASSASPGSAQNNILQSDNGAGEIQWIVSANEACLNSSVCPEDPVVLSATWTLFSNHIAFAVIIGTIVNASGATTARYITTDAVTMWKVGPGSAPGTKDVWIVSGTNYTTSYSNGAQQSTIQPLQEFDTGAPAQQITFGCVQLVGGNCPNNVSAIESVTHVS